MLLAEASESSRQLGPQEVHIGKIFSQERWVDVADIAQSLGAMSPHCRLAVCIPAYRESGVLAHTLAEYTVRQVTPDGRPLDPASFEINLLLNRPNAEDPRDDKMMAIVEDFRAKHPEYRINVAEITYDFAGRAPIGRIYADIADAIILRNTERQASEWTRSRLIMRTAGADVEALNPLLLSRTMRIFEDPSIIAHRGESRLPPELLREFPLLHFVQTFSIYAKRRLRGRLTMNWPFSYTADAYARAGGFDTTLRTGEEANLCGKILHDVQSSAGAKQLKSDLVIDVLNNPRRQVATLLGGGSMSGRYSGFGNPEQEMHVRAMENSWKTIDQDSLPEYCRLTAENLSREMSDYYRKYIERLPQWTWVTGETLYDDLERMYRGVFAACGITEYYFHRSPTRAENFIEIRNIAPLIERMEQRSFTWASAFESPVPTDTASITTHENDRVPA